MELYKLAVEMADRVSARRGAANTYYASLQSAIVATLALLTSNGSPSRTVLVAVCVVGMLTSVSWYVLLRSYRDLNRAKFDVVTTMEEQLPVKVFADEWELLKRTSPPERRRLPYIELGRVERLIPWLFAVVDLLLAIYLGTSA